VDVYATILPQYRAALEPALVADISAAAAKMDLDVLLPSFKSFIMSQLNLDFISPTSELKASLDWTTLVDDEETGAKHHPCPDLSLVAGRVRGVYARHVCQQK
jgi:hypothetical protein